MSIGTMNVLVVQRRMTHYRTAFFNLLRANFENKGLILHVAHGEATDVERMKADEGELPWAIRLRTRYLLGDALCWQPFAYLLAGMDMVVVTQENKLICNLPVQYFRKRVRLGLWGHGANLQGDERSWKEKFKRLTSKQADWWFVYTRLSVPLIERAGFPGDRITVLNNTIDTEEFAGFVADVEKTDTRALAASLGLAGHNVGIFIGSLYEEKRIDFLLEAASRIRTILPDFELLIVGSGPQKNLVAAYCDGRPWIRYVGPKVGRQKAQALAVAKVMLNPGGVGLGILDAFVAGIPLVTTNCGLHGPEIAYLRNGSNGVMTRNDLASYAGAVADVFVDNALRQRLAAGCRASASEFSLVNMAEKFTNGVVQCLARPGRR